MTLEKGEKPRKELKDKIRNKNIAGRLPKNSRNSFVDLQSQKDSKKQTKKEISSFH